MFEKNVNSSSVGFLWSNPKRHGVIVIVDFINNLNKENYVTKFGDDNCMLSCTCYSRRRIGYSC